MRNVTEDKIIKSFAVLGMATLLTAIVAATVTWIDPFLSFNENGGPTILGRLFVYGIYATEALAGLAIFSIAWILFWSFIPKRKSGCIQNMPHKCSVDVTGLTHGVNN